MEVVLILMNQILNLNFYQSTENFTPFLNIMQFVLQARKYDLNSFLEEPNYWIFTVY